VYFAWLVFTSISELLEHGVLMRYIVPYIIFGPFSRCR